jgi:hypothetical protein
MRKVALMMVLAGAVSLAGSKDRDWQSGKVLDSYGNSYFAARLPTADLNAELSSFAGTSYNVNRSPGSEAVADTYVIETDDVVYLVERVRLKLAAPAKVRSYTKVKFAVEKKKLWLVDADGKEYQTKIVEQKRRSL